MEEHPFPDLKIDSHEFLDRIQERSLCPRCNKTRKYYCYTCYTPAVGTEDLVPKVKLPIKVDIIKHPAEVDGKCTGVHAGVVAPDDVTIYTYPDMPTYTDKDRVVVVYPGNTSVSLTSLAEEWTKSDDTGCSRVDENKIATEGSENTDDDVKQDSLSFNSCEASALSNSKTTVMSDINKGHQQCTSVSTSGSGCYSKPPPIDRVVFLESTWHTVRKIYNDPRMQGLKCVELNSHETKFWRHQKGKPREYLATIEAIYYFVREYHDCFVSKEYHGEYDNLLFFFCFMYDKIRVLYDGGKHLIAYKNDDNVEK